MNSLVFRRSVSFVSATAFLTVSFAPAGAFAGTSHLGGNAVLENLTRVSLKSSDANAVSFEAVANAKVGVLDWSKLNVGHNQTMSFDGSGTTFFNLVDGAAGKSQIDGIINGNGNVWVINPAGIAFGATASVNVDGVFAAAAGAIGNADALRNGTASLPAFDSFNGSVEATKGSFTADQVALMGKTVNAEGDFTGVKGLSVAASTGAMTVDEVEGGRISVNIADFVPDDAEVTLGGLSVDGALSVRTTGGIATGTGAVGAVPGESRLLAAQQIGPVIQAGDIELKAATDLEVEGALQSTAGHVDLLAYGNMDVNAEVEAADYVSLQALGDIDVNADVTADGEAKIYSYNGSVTVEAGKTVSALGNVDITAGMGDGVRGDVTISGTVRSETTDGYAWIWAGYGNGASGDVTVGDSGSVSAADVLRIDASGDIKVDGTLSASQAELYALGDGDVVISEGAMVSAQDGGSVYINTATVKNSSGDVRIDGEVVALGNGGRVEIRTGQNLDTSDEFGRNGEGGSGDIVIGGTVGAVGANSRVMLYSANGKDELGNIIVNECGTVFAQGDAAKIQMTTGIGENSSGDIDIAGTVTVEGDEGALILATGNWNGGSGDINISGLAGAYGFFNDLEIITGKSAGSIEGDINISGTVESDGILGYALISSATEAGSQGNVVISGNVKVTGEAAFALIESAEGAGAKGDVTVANGGSISFNGDGGSMVIRSAFSENSEGSVKIEGNVSMSGEVSDIAGEELNAFLEVGAALGAESKGAVLVDGEVNVSGDSAGALISSGLGTKSKGAIEVAGRVNVRGQDGRIDLVAASGAQASGTVVVSGSVNADATQGAAHLYAGYGDGANGTVLVERGGKVSANGNGGEVLLLGGYGTEARGSVDVSGVVSASGNNGAASVICGFGSGASGDIDVNGTVSAADNAQLRTGSGNVRIEGTVSSNGDALVLASGASAGDIHFGENGSVRALNAVNIIAEGDVTQAGLPIDAQGGYVDLVTVNAAISADTVVFGVDGSVGSANGYVGVKGKTYGVIGGNASVAAAEGANFIGGDSSTAPTSQTINSIESFVRTVDKQGMMKNDMVVIDGIAKDFSSLGGTASLIANGELSIYTSGKLEPNGLLKADGDITVSAASFGDMSYLQAGGKLTINNVGHHEQPLIAYFESIDGHEPRVANLPNDTLVFVDGRLVGGNLKMISKMGAMEAFPVSTPELKSEQGIFGNPTFLHGDLDVAEPMAVGCVDYLIQEVPRLLLSGDFPVGVDRNVQASGLNPKDIYRFGQRSVAERKTDKPDANATPDEHGDEAQEQGEKQESGDGKVAML